LVDVNRKICRLRPVEQTAQTAQEKNDASHPTRSCSRSRPVSADCFSGATQQWPARSGSGRDRYAIRHAPGRGFRADTTVAIRSARCGPPDDSLSLRQLSPLQGIALEDCADRTGVGRTQASLLRVRRLLERTVPG
jgi:hypothetical protein